MKKFRLPILILLWLLGSACPAQVGTAYRLGGNLNLSDVYWKDSIYLYRDFQKGQLTYDGGFTPRFSWPMNYNIYFEAMSFINKNGDTLLMRNPAAVRLVTLGDNIFYFDKRYGFVQVLKAGDITLAVKDHFILEGAEVLRGISGSGYGERPRLVYTPSDVRGRPYYFTRVYRKARSWFLIDKYERVYPANAVLLLRIMNNSRMQVNGSNYKAPVKRYIDEYNVDFTNRKDLESIIDFCNELIQSAGSQ